MLIEIHMIQNHSPSNLNRDDLGAPKTCVFGGVTRARISSQCLKRAIRNPGNSDDVHNRGRSIFADAMRDVIGCRTKFFPKLVKDKLASSKIPAGDHSKIVERCKEIAKKEKEGDRAGKSSDEAEVDDRPRTAQLLFLGLSEAQDFVKRLEQMKLDKKWGECYKSWLDGELKGRDLASFLGELSKGWKRRSVDIALFGRMTTSDAFKDVEAAMQVAHAFSTHAVVNEVDYFTAVDDLGKSGGGAGHVDESLYNSACFYKYFCLDLEQLIKNLGGDCSKADGREAKLADAKEAKRLAARKEAERLAAAALGHFLRAAALTTPTGKQNSFAAHNPPDAILVEIKETNIPASYANAFAEPVDPGSEGGLVGQSVRQLGQYVREISNGYGIHGERLWFSPSGRYRLTWVDRQAKPEQEKPVVEPPDHVIDNFETLVERVVCKATGLQWSDVKDAGRVERKEA